MTEKIALNRKQYNCNGSISHLFYINLHFSLVELEPNREHSIGLKIFITLWIIFGILFVSIINSIIQATQGHPGLRIFYAFLNFFIFLALHSYIFNRGYKGIAKDESLLFLFKIGFGILAIAYLVFSIISAGAFDGWVRVGDFWSNDSPDGKS